jgi:hypothetical protein
LLAKSPFHSSSATAIFSADRQPGQIFIEPALSTFPQYHHDELRSTERIIIGVSDQAEWWRRSM